MCSSISFQKTSSASRCFFHSRQETLTRPSETVPRRVECGNQWTQSPIIPCCQCPYWSLPARSGCSTKALPVTLQSNPPKTSHSKELFGSIHQWPFDFTNESVLVIKTWRTRLASVTFKGGTLITASICKFWRLLVASRTTIVSVSHSSWPYLGHLVIYRKNFS